MAETADDLSTPLGQKKVRQKRRYRLPFTGTQALAVLLGLFLVGFAALFAWQIGGFVRRNRPRAYTFDDLPKALLP